MRLLVSSALSVNKISILFWKKKMINLNLNPYRFGRRLVPVADWPDILPNWSMIFSGQTTENTIPYMEFRTTQHAYFVSVKYHPNLLKGRRLRNRKQNTRQHRIRMRENGGSLDFNFISLLNPTVDENWVCRHRLLQFFLKWCRVRYSNLFRLFLWTAALLKVTTFFVHR